MTDHIRISEAPLLDEKAQDQIRALYNDFMKHTLNAFISDGVTKEVLEKQANAAVKIIVDDVDRADKNPGDGFLSKQILKQKVAVFSSVFAGFSELPLSEHKEEIVAMLNKAVDALPVADKKHPDQVSAATVETLFKKEIARFSTETFATLDTNKDNKISATEALFAKLDTNKDGFIDLNEAVKGVGYKAITVFPKVDMSGDFRISPAEANIALGKILGRQEADQEAAAELLGEISPSISRAKPAAVSIPQNGKPAKGH